MESLHEEASLRALGPPQVITHPPRDKAVSSVDADGSTSGPSPVWHAKQRGRRRERWRGKRLDFLRLLCGRWPRPCTKIVQLGPCRAILAFACALGVGWSPCGEQVRGSEGACQRVSRPTTLRLPQDPTDCNRIGTNSADLTGPRGPSDLPGHKWPLVFMDGRARGMRAASLSHLQSTGWILTRGRRRSPFRRRAAGSFLRFPVGAATGGMRGREGRKG